MHHWFTYPLVHHPYHPELVSQDGIVRVSRAAEAAGFSGIGFTDHPAPSQKWLSAGGHDALDPFAVFGAISVVTRELRLIPNILVLPYRNPFIVAKAAATLDVLSGGRFVLSVAAGYLRSEYRALGVDFEQRNALFDEALAVLRGVWGHDELSFEGTGFTATGVTANPKPSRVPIWIGGNSRLSRRRVAQHGNGWNPFQAPPSMARTARTVPLQGLDDLAPMLEDLWAQVTRAGREPSQIDVAFGTGLPGPGDPAFHADQHLATLDDMASLGVTWSSTTIPGGSVAEALEAIERYGAEVIRPMASDESGDQPNG